MIISFNRQGIIKDFDVGGEFHFLKMWNFILSQYEQDKIHFLFETFGKVILSLLTQRHPQVVEAVHHSQTDKPPCLEHKHCMQSAVKVITIMMVRDK